MPRCLPATALLLLLALLPAAATAQPARSVRANGVELHYIEQGAGEPVVLLHGGQGDYRAWGPQFEALSPRFRVVAYSRRYNFPNINPPDPGFRSAYGDAQDLDALLRALGLGRVHLVGTSAGALAALIFATQHPERVRSLVLAEPPVHAWARNDPAGRPLYDAFMSQVWRPAGAAFRRGDDAEAMRVLVDGFAGPGRFERMPAAARAASLQNAGFFRVATASPDPFPEVSKAEVQRLRMPILIVTGANTVPLHRFVNEELARLLPRARRVTIEGAGHGSARENPAAFNRALAEFLPHERRKSP